MNTFQSQNMEPLIKHIYCLFSFYASKSKYAVVKLNLHYGKYVCKLAYNVVFCDIFITYRCLVLDLMTGALCPLFQPKILYIEPSLLSLSQEARCPQR